MASSDLMVGLEIGTSKICVVVGEGRPDGTIKILGVGQAPSRGVRKGEIVDFETAMKCVHEAVVDAETKSDVMIRSVYVGVAGSHIQSFNNRGCVVLPEDRDEIDEQDIEDVKINAREVSIPAQNAFLHSIIQHYHVDGQDGVLNPVGMLGQKLEADFHIIHGVRTRIQNTIRCVKELPLEVEDVVFTALASAQVVLTQHQKNLGALVIDIGGGTTDYILYVDGAVKQSGVLGVGGDHITNDISMGLRIPMTRAEKLKIEEGSVTLGNCLPGDTVLLKDDSGFAGKEIERETLNTIIHLRLRETFELLEAAAGGGTVHQLHRRRDFHHRRMQPSEWHRPSGGGNFRIAGPRRSRADDVGTDLRFREPAVLRRDRIDQVCASRPGRSAPARAASAACSEKSSAGCAHDERHSGTNCRASVSDAMCNGVSQKRPTN